MEKLLNRKIHKQRRQRLRNRSTRPEKLLWKALSHSKFEGRKFRRQQGIGSYIVDFYCPSEKLIVEVDGPIHEEPENIAYDGRRNGFLQKNGFKVLHVSSGDVLHNLDEVLDRISACFSQGPPPVPLLPEEGERVKTGTP